MKKILFSVFALIASCAGLLGTSLLTEQATAAETMGPNLPPGYSTSSNSSNTTVYGPTLPSSGDTVCQANASSAFLTRWCEGLPANPDFTAGREKIADYVIILVSNIYSMITDIAAYIAVILVMWGGFQYITSSGDPGKNVKGRKTIVNSLIGIVIVKGSDIVFRVVKSVLVEANASTKSNAQLAQYIANKFFFWSGVFAVLMMVWGALQYTSSVGDPAKATKARKTIISAGIGLGIVILAAIIVSTVINTLQVNN